MFLRVSLFVNCYLPRFSANSNSKSPDLLKAQNKNTKNFNFFLTKASLFAIISLAVADVAHPVERHLAKVEVASSSLVIRSNAPVAQLDRVTGYEPVGQGFESLPARQEKSHLCLLTKVTFFNDIRSLWNG